MDGWSARWVGQFNFDSGTYFFRARADDGVRVYLNQTLMIDAWRDGYSDNTNRFIGVGRVRHEVVILSRWSTMIAVAGRLCRRGDFATRHRPA